MPADFSLLQTPNFAQAALSGYQAGQSMAKQRQLDTAMAGIDLERPESLLPILRADPSTGAALAGVALKMHAAKAEQAVLGAKGDYLTALGQSGALGGSAGSTPSAPTAPAASAPTGSTTDANGDIVVTAPAPHADLQTARAALMRADPDAYLELETKLGSLSKVQREQVDAANDTFGAAVQAAKAMPYEQRRAYIATQRDQLIAHGVPQAQIDAFDPTDSNIVGIENQVLGIKGVLERQDKDRNYKLQTDKFEHDVSHDAATLGVSQGNLAVSQGQLSLSRQREGRVASGAGAKATGGGSGAASPIARPTNASEYNALPKGARYMKNGTVRVKS